MKKLALNNFGDIVNIDKAVLTSKGGQYYDENGKRLDAVINGEVDSHFRCMEGDYIYSNESALHSDSIIYWCNKNYFELDNFIIKPYETIPNKKSKDFGGFIPDAIMIDIDNNVIGWIEVEVTHDNTKEKNKYIYDNNILCIKIEYGKQDSYNKPKRMEILRTRSQIESKKNKNKTTIQRGRITEINNKIKGNEKIIEYYGNLIQYYDKKINIV